MWYSPWRVSSKSLGPRLQPLLGRAEITHDPFPVLYASKGNPHELSPGDRRGLGLYLGILANYLVGALSPLGLMSFCMAASLHNNTQRGGDGQSLSRDCDCWTSTFAPIVPTSSVPIQVMTTACWPALEPHGVRRRPRAPAVLARRSARPVGGRYALTAPVRRRVGRIPLPSRHCGPKPGQCE